MDFDDRDKDYLLGILEQQTQLLEFLCRLVLVTHNYSDQTTLMTKELDVLADSKPWRIRLNTEEIKEGWDKLKNDL